MTLGKQIALASLCVAGAFTSIGTAGAGSVAQADTLRSTQHGPMVVGIVMSPIIQRALTATDIAAIGRFLDVTAEIVTIFEVPIPLAKAKSDKASLATLDQ